MREYQQCLLDPEQCVVLIIDHQPHMYFGVESASRAMIMNSVLGLAKTAAAFGVPCLLTTVEANTFSGHLYSKLQNALPQTVPIDRTAINCWEDQNLRSAVEATGRKNVILSGLWTEACVTFPALSMYQDGYKVYVAVDACAGASKAAHENALTRMTKAGVIPLTWQQLLLEFQRDWNNMETYDAVMSIVKEHGGAYGLSFEFNEQVQFS
jgi:nicotinamidase-related amidase